MMLTSSPYTVSRPPPPERFIPRWDAEGREVVPQLVEALVDTSRRPVAVIANHGMGKTTVAEAVARAIGTAAHLIPIDCKMERVTEPVTWLKNVLGATQGTWLEAAAAACEAGPVGLWFDEVDVWCRDADGVEPTRRLFSLLKSAQEHVAQLRVIVTGGVGVLTLDQPFGSGMVGRMTTMTLRPFDLDDIDTMIAWDPSPAWRSRVHPWREAILTFSGGCPRLVVSALDHFWVHGAASVETLMRESLASDAHYVRQVLEAVGKGNEKLSPV